MRKQARDLMEGRLNAAGFRPETRDRLQRFGRYSPTSFGFDCDYRNYDWLLVLSLLLLLEITICLGFVFKIQDYFIILSEKLKHGWTLTTSQYTITHILYFKTQRSYWIYISYIINKLVLYTHTHTDVWTDRFICSEMLLTAKFCSHCTWFRYRKLSTKWKKLIMLLGRTWLMCSKLDTIMTSGKNVCRRLLTLAVFSKQFHWVLHI